MSESTFDPRFDPAFQRGYVPRPQDPRQAVVSPVTPDDSAPPRALPGRRSTERSPFAAPTAVPERPAAAERPAFAVPEAPAPIERASSSAPAFVTTEEPPTDAAEVAPDTMSRPLRAELRNPFLWVLMVGGVVLAFGAWQAYFGAVARQTEFQNGVWTPQIESEFAVTQAIMTFSPTLVAAGLLVAAVGVAVLALRWRR